MSQPTPATCRHSFPDPYPAPLTHIGNCRHCDTSYQEARNAMRPPTIAQLHNLTDRAQRGPLTADETARLRDGINRLAEYENTINWMTTCTGCARVLDSCIRETERAERAESALREVLALFAPVTVCGRTAFYQATEHPIHPDDMDRWRAALAEPGPAATQATEEQP